MLPMIALLASSSLVHLLTLVLVLPLSFSCRCAGRMLPVSESSPLLYRSTRNAPGHLALDVYATRIIDLSDVEDLQRVGKALLFSRPSRSLLSCETPS